MASFAKSVGGCPTNIAIGTARLGLKSGAHHPRRRRADGPLHPRAARRARASTRAASKTDPERLTALVLLGVAGRQALPADLLPRRLRRHGARRGRHRRGLHRLGRRRRRHRHAFLDAPTPTPRSARRSASPRPNGRQGGVRHRLPPEPVGPRRPRRGRGALRRARTRSPRSCKTDPARLRPHRRHRGGDADRSAAPRTRSRRCAASAPLAPATHRVQARPDGLRRLSRRDPGRPRGRRQRPGLPGRGLQRARRRRRLHVAASCAAGCATSRWRPAAPTPMPAAPSRCRGCCARRNIRPWRSCSISSRTAAATPRAAQGRGDQPHPLGDDAPAGSPRR